MPSLNDPFVLPRRLHRRAPFADRRAQWFLHIHVLARLAGVDRGQYMPVVVRAHNDRVNVLVVEQLPVVVIGQDLVTPELLPGRVQPVRVQIAHGHDPVPGAA